MSAILLSLPERDVTDVPAMLRNLADKVEAGEFGDAHNVAWVIDCGNARIEVGLLGQCGELAPTLHYLLALGIRKVEDAGT